MKIFFSPEVTRNVCPTFFSSSSIPSALSLFASLCRALARFCGCCGAEGAEVTRTRRPRKLDVENPSEPEGKAKSRDE